MSRRVLLIGSAVVVAVLLGWYFFLYSPITSDTDSYKQQTEQAQNQNQDLTVKLHRLQALQQSAGSNTDVNRVVDQLVPATAELATFIDSANAIANESGIDFLSISPTPPAANPSGGPSVIALSIQIKGTFYDLLKYLNALQDPAQMPRLVVIDSVNITADSSTVSFAGQSPTLSVTLAARMFTRASPAGTPGATATTTPSSTSTPSSTTGATTTTSARIS